MIAKSLLSIPVIMAILTGCAAGPTTEKCTKPGFTPITIHYKKDSEIRVTPPLATVYPGKALRFKMVGPVGRTVKVSGKESTDAWIEGDGTGSSRGAFFFVCVDPAQATGDYGYKIEVDQVGTLDPRVRVVDN